ncbi:MAG: hypothetical protein ACYS1A_00505 [Planctomycetota bacterium]|jgi:hypothetical protein
MNIKKGFQNLATVSAIGIVLLVISGLALGILQLAIKLAFVLAIIWLIYKSVIFVMEGFKDSPKGESQSD